MDSLNRTLKIFDLLTPEKPAWTVEELAAALDCSTATSYRYVKSLLSAGFLAAHPGKTYGLGARIIELDRQLRLTEPLLVKAMRPMEELSLMTGRNLALCAYYNESTICIDKSWIRSDLPTLFDRGRPVPLFRGAAGKVILAHLPTHRLKAVYAKNGPEIEKSGLGATWPDFAGALKTIRRQGHYISIAEVDPLSAGIGVPILDSEKRIMGSLTFAVPSVDANAEATHLLPLLKKTVAHIQWL